ncbi:MAG: vitamin K epoxide reductase family protein [Dehalococcoidia bacterium]|nr:vitamin K epoxide reductase family protein [Dehalococcoidia bacterium]
MIGLPGGAIGGYLTYVRWADRPAACYGIGECGSVQTSSYSEVAGVPVASASPCGCSAGSSCS